MIDAAPPIWLPPKPAIIRPIEQKLLRPDFLPASRAERRAAVKELIARKVITPEQAKRALVGFFVPATGWGTTAAIEFRTSTSSTANVTDGDYSFAATDIGAAAADRDVLVYVSQISGTGVTGITVGGITADQLIDNAFYMARVPTGTTATIVVTITGPATQCFISVWRITGLMSRAAFHVPAPFVDVSLGTTATIDINVAQGGVAAFGAIKIGAGGFAWTNATERSDTEVESVDYSTADYTNSGGANETPRTVSLTFTAATTRILFGVSLR